VPAPALERHADPAGAWELFRRPPDRQLRALVGDYQGFTERADGLVLRREVPTARIPVILHLDAPYGVTGADGATRAHRAGFAAGMHETAATTESPRGRNRCLQLDLAPAAAHRLFGVPMHELANRVVALDDLLGPSARELQERLCGAPTWEARFGLLDDLLLRRLVDAERSRELDWAWHALRRSGGQLRIATLAGELGWSHRHLIARFRREIGLPPKTVARIVRFERALDLARGSATPAWADIAHACGYADQAHLIRDFRAFTGTTPGAWTAPLTAA
jgi:AraC-like DNA-binding protein